MRYKIICRTDAINKNGEAPLYLLFYHNGRKKKVSTGVVVDPKFWDNSTQQLLSGCPNRDELQQKLNSLTICYERKISRMKALEIPLTLDSLLEDKLRSGVNRIGEYFQFLIEDMKQCGKYGSASKYAITHSLIKKIGKSNCRFEDITPMFLRDFERFLVKRGNKPNSIATKFSVLKAVYNKALADKVFICKDNPFATYKVGSHWAKTRKRAIRKEDVQRLREASLSDSRSPYTELSRDIFLFSYFSAGINFKDIATLRYSDLIDGRIYYRRHKTGREMNCRLMPQAQEIINKYSRTGAIEQDYIFPILDRKIHTTEQQIYNRLHKVLVHINRELKEWGKRLGLKTKLSTYVARHTYATVLKRSGVNIAIISESLGHSDLSTTQIYLDSFENTQIDEAMKNLL